VPAKRHLLIFWTLVRGLDKFQILARQCDTAAVVGCGTCRRGSNIFRTAQQGLAVFRTLGPELAATTAGEIGLLGTHWYIKIEQNYRTIVHIQGG
jgi:hypothetical protein